VFEGRGWTRPSTLAKALDDNGALIKWTARMTALGMARSADLTALASTHKPEDRKALDNIVDQALVRAQSAQGANMGTAVHQATYDHDMGRDVSHLPEFLRGKVKDEFGCAGTLDRIYQGLNTTVVGDLKTSRSSAATYSAVSWAIQIAVYSTGVPVVDGQRCEWKDLGIEPPSQNKGAVVHLPSDDDAADTLWLVDLEMGRRLAGLCLQVRTARKFKPLEAL
jgi:hypothetical protein